MRPDRRLVLLVGVLLLAACAKSPTVKPPKIKGSEQIAPDYSYSDSEATRKRVQVRETLGLAAQRFASDRAEGRKRRRDAEALDAVAAAVIIERWLAAPDDALDLSELERSRRPSPPPTTA